MDSLSLLYAALEYGMVVELEFNDAWSAEVNLCKDILLTSILDDLYFPRLIYFGN